MRRTIVSVALVAVLAACSGSGGELRPAQSTTSTLSTAPVIEAPVATISAADAKALLDAGEARAIDVRSQGEYAEGHLPGAAFYDSEAEGFTTAINPLPRDETFVVYDASGDRAGGAVRTMNGLGFLDARVLEGGIDGWIVEGFEVER